MDLAKADSVLKQLLELPVEKRPEHLERTCGDDPGFKAFVARLLAQATADDGNLSAGGGLQFFGVETSDFALHGVARANVGDQIGAFRLVRELGQGGMATVYLAERADGQFEQQVAIKVLDRLGETASRFEQERQILASLDHPHIARLLDGGVTEHGVPYVVMEYVEGVALLDYCSQNGLTVDERIRLFVRVADAVNDAHRKLIVHRDIKSANVLVTAAGTPKLLDFGIAKLLGTDVLPNAAPVTQMAAPMTPEYASPEQIRGEPMSVATDVYQLGFLLYLLLTERSPYNVPARDLAALIHAITDAEPIPPSRRVPGEGGNVVAGTSRNKLAKTLRGDLDRVVLKALHKDPLHRYGSAAALADDLQNVLSHRPVAARPDSFSYRFQKFVQRRALAVAVSAVVLVSMALGVTLFTYRLAQEKQLAETEARKATEIAAFMQDLFSAANPRVAAGESLSAKDMLDYGANRLAGTLGDQPDVKGALLGGIGDAYIELGELGLAEELLRDALELQAESGNTENEPYTKTIVALADVTRRQGRYADAEELSRRGYEASRRVLGPDHPTTQDARTTMGLAILRQSRFQEAENIFREQLSALEETPEDSRIVTVANDLGSTLLMQARYEEGLEAYERSFDLGQRLLGAKHPHTLNALNNIALSNQALGNVELGADQFRQVIALRTEVLGTEHPRTLRSRQHLAASLVTLGEYAQAIDVLQSLYDTRTRVLGDDHPDTLWTLQDLGRSYAGAERYDEAITLLGDVLQRRKRLLGSEHRDTQVSRYYLGATQRAAGHYDTAEQQLLAALDVVATHDTVNTEYTLSAELELAYLYLDSGELRQAASILNTAAGRLETFEALPDLEAELLFARGETLRRQGEMERAELLLVEAYEIQSSNAIPEASATAAALVALYDAIGAGDKAEPYRQLKE